MVQGASGADASSALHIRAKVQEVFECAQAGEIVPFQKAIKKLPMGCDGATLKSLRDEYGRGLLHHAAQLGRAKMVEHLVEDIGFDVNDQDHTGEPPLSLAAATNSDKVVRMLLTKGAKPGLRSEPRGTAPLHRAASAPGTHSLRALLDAGADVQVVSATGSALCWAASAGREEAVKLLLERGASVNLTTSSSSGEDGAAGTSSAGGQQQQQDPAAPSASPLCMAAGACSPACVDMLLKAGADVKARARGSATALHIAAAMGGSDERKAVEVVTLLLAAGADANAKDDEGFIPLVIAAASGRLGVVAALLPHTQRPEGVDAAHWDMQGVVKWSVQQVVAARSGPDAGSEPGSNTGSLSGSTPPSPGPGGRAPVVPEPEEPDEAKAAALRRKGDEAFVGGDLEGAVVAYSQSLRHDTRVAGVWSNRAAAHLRKGNASAALHDARVARTLDPTAHKAWYREGCALAALQQWEDAAGAHFEASHISPGTQEYEKAFRDAIEAGRAAHRAAMAAGGSAGASPAKQ